ncbi:hypothetical protein BOS5A_10479 [Bosea sp. EC-HK365B]|nr:hypothetical protein BOSE21B_10594 [Bosea sp. 21B]CAD5265295.1 hypothetical protein BOSE7B_150543 [Bosea sp. 7B]VVT44460.1 hypothetical protein BOS5A_10479 [Bosea sp. EC-HK365B]VXC46126.1 hypothetical protein BOSE127_190170 [Bosea sp. 127]
MFLFLAPQLFVRRLCEAGTICGDPDAAPVRHANPVTRSKFGRARGRSRAQGKFGGEAGGGGAQVLPRRKIGAHLRRCEAVRASAEQSVAGMSLMQSLLLLITYQDEIAMNNANYAEIHNLEIMYR